MADRAAISVYATLGAAAATLVVVGAILVGPAILECSSDAGALGACLRGKAADSGLIAPKVSNEPPAPAGWMEAVANEYEPPLSVPVELEGTPADLLAMAIETSSATPVAIAMAPAADLATLAPAQEQPAASVALGAPQGELSARVAKLDAGPAGIADLSQPAAGTLSAAVSLQAPAAIAVAVEPASGLTGAAELPPAPPGVTVALIGPEGELSARAVRAEPGRAGSTELGRPADGTLTAATPLQAPLANAVAVEPTAAADGFTSAVEPVPSEPAPVELRPGPVPSEPPPSPSEPSSVPEPASPFSEPTVVVEFNPRFPNVLVLPPPTLGDDSSFRSLQLN